MIHEWDLLRGLIRYVEVFLNIWVSNPNTEKRYSFPYVVENEVQAGHEILYSALQLDELRRVVRDKLEGRLAQCTSSVYMNEWITWEYYMLPPETS